MVGIKPHRTTLKVNLGSGDRGLSGWINVDIGTKYVLHRFLPVLRLFSRARLLDSEIVDWVESTGRPPPNLKRWDLRRRLPLPDSCARAVYCAEVIEHFPQREARDILREAYRILSADGKLRVTTPDVNRLCNAFLANELTIEQFNSFFFAPFSDREPLVLDRLAARLYSTRGHMWLYDYRSLRDLLLETGFRCLSLCTMGAGEFPDVEQLEKNLYRARVYSMYVEARKHG